MKSTDIERIITLEWANYAATQNVVNVTPGVDLVLRDDVIITSTRLFPTPEVNHACLLRATPETADSLITEVMDYFKSRKMPVNVFVSPACTPPDLAERLLKWGFREQEEKEAWMVLNLPDFEIPPASPKVVVRRVTKREALAFAKVYLASFGMPVIFAPFMALLMRPSIGLSDIHHYIALVDDKPVGVCLWYSYTDIGCLGGAGVLPTHRGKKVATSLAVKAVTEAKEQGVNTMMVQTVNPKLERLLRMSGFKTAFTRTRYTV